jgi:glutaredoxin domain-containing cysteine-rich protein 1|uniref:Glutaredoxin domain-containing protein n=1 Tax=Fagus sylvatica TaxID=28930 RepID=A0A2N9ITS5_FAGSY
MKGMRGKLFRKLKLIPTFSTLKQGIVLQLNPSEKLSNQHSQTSPVYQEQDQNSYNLSELVVSSTGEFEDNKHPKDEEMELDFNIGNKDTITSPIKSKDIVPAKENPEVPILSNIIMEHDGIHEAKEEKEEYPPLLEYFEEKCPPGGSESVIFYTTSLRGIRKTFEDCNSIRFLLESFKVLFYERDVSIHLEYREELWSILGGRVIPPRLFIKGRYIGGADEVVGLHEQGKLKKLLKGIPLNLANSSCDRCANLKFVVCLNCNGSRKIFADGENDEMYIRCPECNENGLVKCPICC